MDKPSDIHKIKKHKLTRRRVLKAASAAGFTSTAALTMTPEDVKAADSDQVTIPFDTEGNHKIRVDADKFDHYMHSKDVRENIEERFMGRSGVVGIGLSGEDLATVSVFLDPDNPGSDERRGELPEFQDDVAIEINDLDPSSYQTAHKDSFGDCVEHRSCDDETIDLTFASELPGGLRITELSGTGDCTNGPRFINGSFQDFAFGWSTGSHCLSSTDTGQAIAHRGENDVADVTDWFGTVVLNDEKMDIAYIEPDGGFEIDPVSEVVLPSNHDDTVHISGTVSESAMDTINQNTDYPVGQRGVGHCQTVGVMAAFDMTLVPPDNYPHDVAELENQAIFCTLKDHLLPGDSGGIGFVNDNPDGPGNDFAVASATATTCRVGTNNCDLEENETNSWHGPQGYSIRDKHNIWWDDLE